MTIISICKTFIFSGFMFIHSSFKVICYAYVQNVFVLVSHDVNEVVVEEGHDLNNVFNLSCHFVRRTPMENAVCWACAVAREKSPCIRDRIKEKDCEGATSCGGDSRRGVSPAKDREVIPVSIMLL